MKVLTNNLIYMLDTPRLENYATAIPSSDHIRKSEATIIERHRFSFQQWDRYEEELEKCWFTVKKIDTAVHEILWSKLWVWEFFRDNFWLVYAVEEYIKAIWHLRVESSQIKDLIADMWALKWKELFNQIKILVDEWKRKLMYMFPHLEEEIRLRSLAMLRYLTTESLWGINVYDNIWEYLVPTPINEYIWVMDTSWARVIWEWKTMQMVLSVIKWTRNIVGVLITYESTFDEAYKNEFEKHYPGEGKIAIKRAIVKEYWYLPDKFLVFPVIGMKSWYHSLREMLRMMRDASTHLIDDRLAGMPWLAEMDLSNNFFELCANQLDVYPLPLKDENWKVIIAQNKRLDYKSTPVRFNSYSAVEKTRGGVSSVIERTTTPNQHLYKKD